MDRRDFLTAGFNALVVGKLVKGDPFLGATEKAASRVGQPAEIDDVQSQVEYNLPLETRPDFIVRRGEQLACGVYYDASFMKAPAVLDVVSGSQAAVFIEQARERIFVWEDKYLARLLAWDVGGWGWSLPASLWTAVVQVMVHAQRIYPAPFKKWSADASGTNCSKETTAPKLLSER